MKQAILLVSAALAVMLIPLATAQTRPPLTLPGPTTGPSTVNCSSVLVLLDIQSYPECWCEYGPWSAWTFHSHESDSSCPSGKKYVLKRTRSPLSPSCTSKSTETEYNSTCEPTLAEKAQQFIDSLNLGDISTPLTAPVPGAPGPGPPGISGITKSSNTTSPSRRRRAQGFSVPCPATDDEKKICESITKACRSKREAADDDVVTDTLLAQLIQEQDDMYRHQRKKRQLPPTDRNIFFVVDSSGSIGSSNYARTLDVIAEFSELFCGEIGIGLTPFSTHIELEFCPTCFREHTPIDYRTTVADKIRNSRYHGQLTSTAETVKCLADHVLPTSECRILSKTTQLVFFTDGRPNGCLDVRNEVTNLETKYPTLETYAIGVGGSIKTSGVADLLSASFDPQNVFNVQDIDELEALLAQIKSLIQSGSILCIPASFERR